MTTAAPDSLQSQYDAKIDACFAEIRRLREARNADCSKTRKLPSDVLTMIFGILAGDENEVKSYWTLPHWIGWIVVTHVCRTWRSTALSEPTLWTDFSYCHWTSLSSRWLQQLFDRSKTAPLSLFLGAGTRALSGTPSGFHQHIFKQMLLFPERVKSIRIYGDEDYLLALTKPMPNLEKLSLGSGVIPDNFACGSAPRLHSLELRHVVMPLHASWYSNVRTLSLTSNWSPPDKGQPLSVKSFLVFLSRLPRLVDLNVWLPGGMDATVLPPPGDVTQLSLESWKVTNYSSHIVLKKIFQYIAVHTLRRLEVKDVGDSEILDIINFFVTNTRAQPDTVRWKGDEVELVASKGKALELSLWLRLYKCSPSLAPYLPNANIRTLHFLQHWSTFTIVFHMQECQTIEELRIDQVNAFDELMKVRPSDAIPLPYPSLRHLHLKTVSFNPAAENIPRLIQWINARKTISGLEKLTIDNCGLDASEISMLSKIIPVDVVSSGTPT